MTGFLFFLFGLLVTIGMCGLAALSDFKGFRIPNLVALVIVGAFLASYGITSLTGQRDAIFMPAVSHFGAATIVFLITMILFAFKLLGAGDSKFATAVALWLGFQGLAPFLFYMALIGGLLGVVSLALRHRKPFKNPPQGTWLAKAQEGHNAVPYGIAIAGGTVIAFIFLGYFSLDKWAAMFGA
jgi:prepilin peptidase CpaA